MSCFHILEINSLFLNSVPRFFSPHSEGFFFLVWFTVSLPVQKFLRLEKLNSTKPQKLLRLEKINSFVEF